MIRANLLRRVIANQGGIPVDGLVSHWKLDEDPAEHNTTIIDSVGSNNGTLITNDGSTNKSVSGQVGRAIDFDGSDDGVEFPAINTPEFTVCGWVNFANTSSLQDIFSDWSATTLDRQKRIDINSNSIRLIVVENTPQTRITLTAPFSTTGVFVHICAVYASGDQRIYINGALEASDTTAYNPLQTAQDNFCFAKGADDSRYLDGIMDEVLIYNRALSLSEIQQIYNASA